MSPPKSIPTSFAAALLAGGKSSRMGADKALLDWHGEPLWRVQLRKLAELSPARLLLSCRREQTWAAQETGAEQVFDPPDNPGPLGAIVACLETVKMPLLVLAVDMPSLTPAFLGSLLEISGDTGQGVVCHSSHGHEPLAALYPPSALPLLRQQIEAGNFRMQEAVARLLASGLVQTRELQGDEVLLFRNTNTPEEYAAWKTSAPPT